ncbi:MAG: hypothetical protein U9Q73_01780 [Nanoarchaeota archaeon]|nr:hypothetical protein [Nanoarchaeota archaeon]
MATKKQVYITKSGEKREYFSERKEDKKGSWKRTHKGRCPECKIILRKIFAKINNKLVCPGYICKTCNMILLYEKCRIIKISEKVKEQHTLIEVVEEIYSNNGIEKFQYQCPNCNVIKETNSLSEKLYCRDCFLAEEKTIKMERKDPEGKYAYFYERAEGISNE